ncbi:MAG: homoserine O-succinyltransferase [Clostridia bacterium]|nr:homoserine O-succinyltransferase [Clostridia bacterium]
MPIRINEQMPVVRRLEEEQIFVMHESRAAAQDIRELEIAILNIMPDKEDTELQLLRLLSNTPLQVRPTFLRLDSHIYKHVSEEYLQKFYKPFSSVRDRRFDGVIITGAPVETLPFEEVDYWEELTDLLDWADEHVTALMCICWSAQAGLHHYYGIRKHPLPVKLSGVYSHRTLFREEPLTRGFNDIFHAPHSRYTGILKEEVQRHRNLDILAESDVAGIYLVHDSIKHRLFVTGHPEYSRATLANEYTRDLAKGIHPAVPVRYFPNDQPAGIPQFQWKAHANLLFSNWLNYEVYQVTPYSLK